MKRQNLDGDSWGRATKVMLVTLLLIVVAWGTSVTYRDAEAHYYTTCPKGDIRSYEPGTFGYVALERSGIPPDYCNYGTDDRLITYSNPGLIIRSGAFYAVLAVVTYFILCRIALYIKFG